MDNKQIIAQTLLEIAKNSETTFIDIAADFELIDAAEKIGIIVPSPDLAIIKTVYAEIDKVNKNGVILPKKAVEKGIKTLIGKQINWEHKSAGQICGYSIDAKIKDNTIEIIGVIFKSLFPEEMEKIKEKFAKKELAVSFEIWNTTEKGESVVKIRPDGFKEIDPIIFHGTGLLLTSKPACPKAKVFKLLANKTNIIKDAIEKVFDNNLVYASLAVEEPKCQNCQKCKCDKEDKIVEEYLLELAVDNVIEIKEEELISFEDDYDGGEIEKAKKLTYEQKKNLPDSDFAVVITVKNKITGEPRKIRMFPIHDEAHVRNALARLGQEKVKEHLKKLGVSIEAVLKKILKKAKELNMTELLEKYKAEVAELEPAQVTAPAIEEQKPAEQAQVEPAKPKVVVKVTREYSEIIENTYVDGTSSGTTVRKGHSKTITEYSDGTKDITESDSDSKIVYTFSELEGMVKAAEEIIIAALPKEVTDCVKNKIKEGIKPAEAVKSCWEEYKNKNAQLVADEIGKKEIEISTIKTEKETIKSELEQKIQEIATLKIEKAKENQPILDLTIGNVDTKKKENDELAERRKKIDERAFGKKK